MVPEDAPNRLIVEGPDDQHSLLHLMRRHGVDWDNPGPQLPHVRDSGGYEKLLVSLEVCVRTYTRLGIVIDADVDPQGRWGEVNRRLETLGVALPQNPPSDGVVVNGIRPRTRVGVWLMPDNRQSGAIEEFLADLIPQNDCCWPYAEEASSEARRRGAPFPEKDFLKARIHTWLAWQKEPGLPFGTALTARYFRSESEPALRFVSWFRRLFLEG